MESPRRRPGPVDYPSFFRIRDGLTTARDMGANVVRAHTVGVSLGTPKTLAPSLGTTNPAAFVTIDYSVAQAKRLGLRLGLRLVVPLTDNWQWYFGCAVRRPARPRAEHARQRRPVLHRQPGAGGIPGVCRHTLPTHVNPWTGLTYAADPTIMAWDLGNELQGMTTEWVQANATFVKGLAPRQLVAAGQGIGVSSAVLAAAAVDISDTHYYTRPASDGDRCRGGDLRRQVFVAGEFGSTGAARQDWGAVTGDGRISGALYWSLFPLADHYGYVRHDDG